MTIRQRLTEHLHSGGLWPEQMEQILDQWKFRNDSMAGRMDEQEDGYTEPLLVAIFVSVDNEAMKWIDANQPQHWARAFFAHEEGES